MNESWEALSTMVNRRPASAALSVGIIHRGWSGEEGGRERGRRGLTRGPACGQDRLCRVFLGLGRYMTRISAGGGPGSLHTRISAGGGRTT
jgi:hypothetical protein